MLLQPDCIPCILKMSISLIRKLPLEEARIKELYSEILEIPALRGRHWNVTSPEIIERVMHKINLVAGNSDPFYVEKAEINERLLRMVPWLKELVDNADDPVYEAVKLAIIGNSIDFMTPQAASDLEDTLIQRLEISLSENKFASFKRQLAQSELLLYLGDNAGEIVFDKILIETVKEHYNPQIVFVVRNVPTLNDATLKEARAVKIDQTVTVIANGIDGPLPSTQFKRCSDEVRELVGRADLIISKGGGNFDCLHEELKELPNITFMLISKCQPYNTYFSKDLYQPILANFFKP
ncbi:ARMT1-like domain-containing protein [Desulfococcaceae bacterium HSG9]|nr:ARMT1-like domain-containing protein [Desulfococcaceae bacterium HSG9]